MADSDSDVEIKVDRNQSSANAVNPLNPSAPLKRPPPGTTASGDHPQSEILVGDSATTRAEKLERHGPLDESQGNGEFPESVSKRIKTDHEPNSNNGATVAPERRKGEAPIKSEYV